MDEAVLAAMYPFEDLPSLGSGTRLVLEYTVPSAQEVDFGNRWNFFRRALRRLSAKQIVAAEKHSYRHNLKTYLTNLS